MLINAICILVALTSVIFCVSCANSCKYYKAQDDNHVRLWCKCMDDLNEATEKWSKTIDLCNDIIEFNETIMNRNEKLVEENAKLVNHIITKDNENQIHKYGGYVELTEEITDA